MKSSRLAGTFGLKIKVSHFKRSFLSRPVRHPNPIKDLLDYPVQAFAAVTVQGRIAQCSIKKVGCENEEKIWRTGEEWKAVEEEWKAGEKCSCSR